MPPKPSTFIKVLLICIFCLGCTSNKQFIKLDLYSDTSFVLRKQLNQSQIWHLNIQIIGTVDESSQVIISNFKDAVYRKRILNSYDTIFDGDWYSDSVLIKFENLKKPSKNIRLKYQFVD